MTEVWRRLNNRTQEEYDLLTRRIEGVSVIESPDYHAHDPWRIVHLHADGTVPHVHEMEIQAGKAIPIATARTGRPS